MRTETVLAQPLTTHSRYWPRFPAQSWRSDGNGTIGAVPEPRNGGRRAREARRGARRRGRSTFRSSTFRCGVPKRGRGNRSCAPPFPLTAARRLRLLFGPGSCSRAGPGDRGVLSGVDSASGCSPRGSGDGFWPSATSAGRRKRARIGFGDAKRSLLNQRVNQFLLAGAKFALTGPLVLYLFGPCRGAHSASPPSTGIALSITVVVPDRATRKVTCCPEKAGLTDRLMFRRRIAL